MALVDLVRKNLGDEFGNQIYNIIEFAESPKFLNIKLFPVQRFIFKMIYNIPLSDNLEEPIVIRDEFNEKIIYTFTSENDFLKFLYKEGRINVDKQPKDRVFEVRFFVGRRGTKTTMMSILSSHKLYELEMLEPTPQEYFGVIPHSEISIAVISNKEENATKQAQEIGNMVYSTDFFKPYLVNPKEYSNRGFDVFVKKQLEDRTRKYGLLKVKVSAASPSIRGGNNIVVALDEFCHFIDSNKSTKSEPLDELIYTAATPSVSGFKYEDDTPAGLILIASSPNGKKGKGYELYKESFNNPNVIMINVPSHWVNPTLSSIFLKSEYKKSPFKYKQEFLAEFVSSFSSFIPIPNKVRVCEDLQVPNQPMGSPNIPYFVGVDPALTNDGFALAIGHFDSNIINNRSLPDPSLEPYLEIDNSKPTFVYDFIHSWTPTNHKPLDPDEVMEEMFKILKNFRVVKIAIDNWAKEFISKYFERNGYNKQVEFINPTVVFNNEVATLFSRELLNGRLIWSPYAIEERITIKDEEETIQTISFTEEVIDLQVKKVSGSFIKVEAPNGKHDDRFSAATKALFMGHKYYEDFKNQMLSINNLRNRVVYRQNKRLLRKITGRIPK